MTSTNTRGFDDDGFPAGADIPSEVRERRRLASMVEHLSHFHAGVVVVGRTSDPEAVLATVSRYLPDNYSAHLANDRSVLVAGNDVAGWTWEGYVKPRLASGLYLVIDVTEAAARDTARLRRSGVLGGDEHGCGVDHRDEVVHEPDCPLYDEDTVSEGDVRRALYEWDEGRAPSLIDQASAITYQQVASSFERGDEEEAAGTTHYYTVTLTFRDVAVFKPVATTEG